MPYELEEKFGKVAGYIYRGPCGYTVYGDTRLSYIMRQWNNVEHRPKPSTREEMLNNMTSRGEQYTISSVKSQLVIRYGWKWFVCDGKYLPFERDRNFVYEAQPLHGNSLLPNTDLDLRLAIQQDYTNLGVNLAEYRQTSKMFQGFARSVKSAWNTFVRKRPRRRRPITPCSVATAHLVNTYGIQPLASDLFESVEVLKGRLFQPIIRRHTAYARKQERFHDVQTTYWQDQTNSVSKSSIAYSWMTPNARQFTLGNPLYLAWELVPYSFVVDWAIPIGDWLMSLDALIGISKVRGTTTTKSTIHCTKYGTPYYGSGPKGRSPPAKYKLHKISRATFSSIPIPPLPKWDPSTSYKAVTNGIALLTAVNKKCKK